MDDESLCSDSDEETLAALLSADADIPSNTGAEEAALSAAIDASRTENNLRQLALRINNEKLNRRLEVNGMERQEVSADGNCFFKAASLHLAAHDEVTLRETLCQHIVQNIHIYMEYFPDCSSANFAIQDLSNMLLSGTWNLKFNDALPLALANLTGRRVKIFTSKQEPATWDVTPTVTSVKHDEASPIYLAMLAPTGQPEHYDGCLAKRRHISSVWDFTAAFRKKHFSPSLSSCASGLNRRC
ncbi:hypothetical protein V1264_024171 [Littorina saxatilis]|uniref:OTU domain-containing protein n=1 Tax=Littorina saxatilis TaxID=31220 RepID=A0AAN9ALG9_9CAEN